MNCLKNIKKDEIVWTRVKDSYYVEKITNAKYKYWNAWDKEKAEEFDIRHTKECHFYKVGGIDSVPGVIVNAFSRPSQTLCKIGNDKNNRRYTMSSLKIKDKRRNIECLKIEYDKLQEKYGAKELDSIYNGGCVENPDICFVFMNPTGKNIASSKTWTGRKSPWLGTKNIWKLFNKVDLLSNDTYNKILEKKPKEWDYDFCDYVYDEIERNKVFITNLGKCTQIDARPLSNDVLKQYLDLLFEEIYIIKPKVVVTFGNQVSSIILNKRISVSENRKISHDLKVKDDTYKIFPVYYPVGNGIFNIDKSIEDIKWIMKKIGMEW